MAKITKDSSNGKQRMKLNPKTLFSYGLKVAQDLLGMTETEEVKKATLNDIKMEDAQRGKIRLEHKQNLLLNEIRDIEKQKRALFMEGVQKASAREQKILAVKIKQLDTRMRNLDRTLEAIFVQLRIIDSFVMIKEQESLNKEMGLQSVFGDMDLNELVGYMQKSMEDGELNMAVLTGLADKLDKHNYMNVSYSDNDDINEIMKQFELARNQEESVMEQIYQDMDNNLSEKHSQQKQSDDELEFEDL
jgi:hypothetical protein